MRRCCHFIVLIVLLGLPASMGLAQSSAAAQIVMQAAPTVTDNQVELQFSVSDQQGFSPATLSASSIKLSEPNRQLSISGTSELGLTLAVIVNLSNGSDLDLIQDTLHAYFNEYYRPQDKVTFYILGPDANTAQVMTPADQATIMEVIDSLKRSPDVYLITPTLKTVLTNLQAADAAVPRQVLYVGSFLNDPREVNASSIFAGQRIPFNVVLVQRYRPQSVVQHRTLANFGGGLFANNENGTGVALDPAPTAINTVRLLYDAIASSRMVYTLRYQSASDNLDKERTVTLTVTLADGEQAAQSFTYAPEFQPPQVKIISASPSPVRMPGYSGDRVVFDTAEQIITVAVTFPDGVRRGIKSLELVATDTTTGRSRAPRVITAPAPDGSGNYSIPWTFDDYTTPETVSTIELKITAADALGLSGSDTQQAQLTVAALPPPPLPTDVVETVSNVSSTSTNSGLIAGSVADNLLLSTLAALVMALILVVVFLLLALGRLRRRQARMVEMAYQQPVEAAAPPPAAALFPVEATAPLPAAPPSGDDEDTLLGRLVTISGLEVTEIHINDAEFVIGRDASCQYVIDKPFISPRHCMIMLRKNTFFIRDLGGKNGTFVNGERLPKNRDIPVPIGSEVNLTMNISMELWDAKTVVKLHDRKTGATHHSTVMKTTAVNDELVLRSVFGIKFSGEDEGKVDDDYSPI